MYPIRNGADSWPSLSLSQSEHTIEELFHYIKCLKGHKSRSLILFPNGLSLGPVKGSREKNYYYLGQGPKCGVGTTSTHWVD